MKVWIFAELVLMTRQVSDPYSSTDFTLELKILSLVLVEMVVVLHTGLRMAKTWRAFFTLALMSSSVPPDWLILLPRYTNSLTSSTAFPEMVTGASCWLWMRSSLVFS